MSFQGETQAIGLEQAVINSALCVSELELHHYIIVLCYSGCVRLGFTGCLSCHARVGMHEKASAKSSTIELFVAQHV